MLNRPFSSIIQNVHGVNLNNFQRNFHELVNTLRQYTVTLLETRMVARGQLLNDINFNKMIEVHVDGQAGGIVMLWNHNFITIHNFVRREQEIMQ